MGFGTEFHGIRRLSRASFKLWAPNFCLYWSLSQATSPGTVANQMTDSWPTYHDLILAYRDCRLHKPASHSQIEFEVRLAQNIGALFNEIRSGRYRPRPATCFVVTRPKAREIFAADFRDRIVHHLLVTQLEPVWERKFIFSSFACRQGKGLHGAIR